MDFDTFLTKKAELDRLLKTHAKDMVATMFGNFFAANPEIKTVTWRQYTPYFNDGDACVFAVHEPSFSAQHPDEMIGGVPSYPDDEDGWISAWSDDASAGVKAFCKVFGEADSVLETLGDHSRVVVTREPNGEIKVEVETIDHD